MVGDKGMIKTCKTTCGLEGPNWGWLFAASHGTRATRHQLQTTSGRWFLMTSHHCGYSEFVWAPRLGKFTLGCWAREIFGLSEYHSPYVLKRSYCLAAETSRALPWILLWGRQAVPSMMRSLLGKPRDASVVFQRCSAVVVGSLQRLGCPRGVHLRILWGCWCQIQEYGAGLLHSGFCLEFQ